MADLEWNVENLVGTIRLNRPERRNAFTFDMVREWAASCARRGPTTRSGSWC